MQVLLFLCFLAYFTNPGATAFLGRRCMYTDRLEHIGRASRYLGITSRKPRPTLLLPLKTTHQLLIWTTTLGAQLTPTWHIMLIYVSGESSQISAFTFRV